MRKWLVIVIVVVACVSVAFRKEELRLVLPGTFPKPVYKFKDNKLTEKKFQLGRRLFYDPILSADSTVSCESCHQRVAAFGHIDHVLSHGIGGQIGKRNVPSLQNMIWGTSFMWDGSISNLERQSVGPITNPIEMNESMQHVVEKLQRNDTYSRLFADAFGTKEITEEMVLMSLTQFVGSLVSADSRYDRYIAGTDTFNAMELSGLKLFRQYCAACHPEPLFTDNLFHNNGLAYDTALKDKGRGAFTKNASEDNSFKVPSLRNIEMTYPYMHDGRYRKLRDVLNHYGDKEKLAAIGVSDKNIKSIPALTDRQKVDIISFLLTLTDRSFLYNKRFSDPFINP